MTEPTGGVRPAVNRPATDFTVPPATDNEREQRRAAYRLRERARNELAMDRYIEHLYGPDAVARSRR